MYIRGKGVQFVTRLKWEASSILPYFVLQILDKFYDFECEINVKIIYKNCYYNIILVLK